MDNNDNIEVSDPLSDLLEVMRNNVEPLTESERYIPTEDGNEIMHAFNNTTPEELDEEQKEVLEFFMDEEEDTLCTNPEDEYRNTRNLICSPVSVVTVGDKEWMDLSAARVSLEESGIAAIVPSTHVPNIIQQNHYNSNHGSPNGNQIVLANQLEILDISQDAMISGAHYSPRSVYELQDYVNSPIGYALSPVYSPQSIYVSTNNGFIDNKETESDCSGVGLLEPVIATETSGETYEMNNNQQILEKIVKKKKKTEFIRKVQRKCRATKAQMNKLSPEEKQYRKRLCNRNNTKNHTDRQRSKKTDLENQRDENAKKNDKLASENRENENRMKSTIKYLDKDPAFHNQFGEIAKRFKTYKKSVLERHVSRRNQSELLNAALVAHNEAVEGHEYYVINKKPAVIKQNTWGSQKSRAKGVQEFRKLELDVVELGLETEKLEAVELLLSNTKSSVQGLFQSYFNGMSLYDKKQWNQRIYIEHLDLPIVNY